MIRPMTKVKVLLLVIALPLLGATAMLHAAPPARDPGVRGGSPDAGGPFPELSSAEQAFFEEGQHEFLEVQSVQGTIDDTEPGLGPRFNLDSCAGCHAEAIV